MADPTQLGGMVSISGLRRVASLRLPPVRIGWVYVPPHRRRPRPNRAWRSAVRLSHHPWPLTVGDELPAQAPLGMPEQVEMRRVEKRTKLLVDTVISVENPSTRSFIVTRKV